MLMKEDKDIEAMYSWFQTLISGLQVLKKIYSVLDHQKDFKESSCQVQTKGHFYTRGK